MPIPKYNKQRDSLLTQLKGCYKIKRRGDWMNQKQMEYFLEVYRQGNIQSAADKLYVSRQGVSKMLKSLEEELGQLLFIRNPHGLVPTDYANALLPHVQRLLAEYRSIASMSTLASQSKSVVTIYALDHIMAYLGAEFLWDFHQACPDIILSTVDTTDDAVVLQRNPCSFPGTARGSIANIRWPAKNTLPMQIWKVRALSARGGVINVFGIISISISCCRGCM